MSDRNHITSDSLTSLALSVQTEGAGLRLMRCGHIADPVKVLALLVRAALADRVVGAGPVQVAGAPAAPLTVQVVATL